MSTLKETKSLDHCSTNYLSKSSGGLALDSLARTRYGRNTLRTVIDLPEVMHTTEVFTLSVWYLRAAVAAYPRDYGCRGDYLDATHQETNLFVLTFDPHYQVVIMDSKETNVPQSSLTNYDIGSIIRHALMEVEISSPGFGPGCDLCSGTGFLNSRYEWRRCRTCHGSGSEPLEFINTCHCSGRTMSIRVERSQSAPAKFYITVEVA
ncbi:hypothetical protein GGS20DRAFT_589136 [Poronia punctata]|nr:hypothetical protein GGS20DRAFT_589136 [Poronia punctata]